jgi:hypothetical protein
MRNERIEREVKLEMTIQSHLSDLAYDNQETLITRVQFVKSLIFFHSNLNIYVTDTYLKWMWKEVEQGEFGCSFEDFEKK